MYPHARTEGDAESATRPCRSGAHRATARTQLYALLRGRTVLRLCPSHFSGILLRIGNSGAFPDGPDADCRSVKDGNLRALGGRILARSPLPPCWNDCAALRGGSS